MADNPYALWDDLAAFWSRALTLASGAAVPWPVRGRAASLCRLLACELVEDDALAFAAVYGASACLECFPVAHDLLIAGRQVAVDGSCLIGPILSLCGSAHLAGHHDTVVIALLELLEVAAFDGGVPAVWLVAADSVDGEGDYWLRRLVRRWVELFGANNDGVRAVIRQRADVWFPTQRFRLDILRALHAAEPTAAGWVALTGMHDELRGRALGLSFGDRHADAVDALNEALLRALPAATHLALKRWLVELTA